MTSNTQHAHSPDLTGLGKKIFFSSLLLIMLLYSGACTPLTSDIPLPSQPLATQAPAACITDPNPQRGIVTKITDGDTIHVLIDGRDFPVRYIGIDTPENTTRHEPFGPEASQKNRELVADQTVTLYRDKSETDRYDRLLRYVFVGPTFVNRELVSLGYAEAIEYPPDTACAALLGQAETGARAQALGMWALAGAAIAPTSASPGPAVGGSLAIIAVDKKAEYVTIQNPTSVPIDLSGWTLLSEKGSQTCALGGIIQSGASLTIYAQTGPGYSCNHTTTIWNNSSPDPAVLLNPQGQEISRY